ncbi:MAG: TolC family protein [Bacteroidales bacterium]|nr:TolC family protein [Bacteroidales bacterium]
MNRFVLLLFLIFSVFLSIAQSTRLTFEQCVLLAISNNVQVKMQDLSLLQSKEQYLKNKMQFLPSINANANQGYTLGRTIDPLTNEFAESNVRSNNFAVSANWTLFSGFQNIHSLRQNYYLAKASEKDLQKTQSDVILAVTSSYLQILLAQELLNVAIFQRDLTKQQAERTKKLFEVGNIAQGTLLEIESQLASDEMQVVIASNNLSLAKLTLFQLIEVDFNDSTEIEKPNIIEPDSIFPVINPEQVFAEASQFMPAIKSAELKMLAAQKGLSAAQGYRLPRITLGASYATGYSSQRKEITGFSWDTPYITGYTIDSNGNQYPVYSYNVKYDYKTADFNKQLNDNISKSLTINLTIPIFNNWQANYTISSAKINAMNAKYNYELQQKQVEKEVQQAYHDALSAYKKYIAAKKAEAAAKEAFRYVEQKFSVGLLSSYDFNQSKTSLMRAQSELLKAKYEYIFKLKVLDYYTGKPIKF